MSPLKASNKSSSYLPLEISSLVLFAPGARDELALGEHPPRMPGEVMQQLELLHGKGQVFAAVAGSKGSGVDLQVSKHHLAGRGRRGVGGAPQQRLDADHHHAWAEWLRYIIVRPEAKTQQLIHFVIATGEEHNGRGGTLADAAAHLHSIQTWHHYIKDDQIWREAPKCLQGFLAVIRLDSFVALGSQVVTRRARMSGSSSAIKTRIFQLHRRSVRPPYDMMAG